MRDDSPASSQNPAENAGMAVSPPPADEPRRERPAFLNALLSALAEEVALPILKSFRADAGDARLVLGWLPAAGAIIGLAGALTDGVLAALGLSSPLTALLAVMMMIGLTAARREIGFARFVDETFKAEGAPFPIGLLFLIGLLLLKVAAIASLNSSAMVFAALVGAMAWSRAMLPAMAAWLDPNGGSDENTNDGQGILIAAGLGLVLSLVAAGPETAAIALVVGTLTALFLGFLAHRALRQDKTQAIGAAQQVTEAVMLCCFVAVQAT